MILTTEDLSDLLDCIQHKVDHLRVYAQEAWKYNEKHARQLEAIEGRLIALSAKVEKERRHAHDYASRT